MNFSNSFPFYGLDYSGLSLTTLQNLNLLNYQQLSYPQYFWMDQNILMQASPSVLTYGLQSCYHPEMPISDPKSSFCYQNTEESDIIQISAPLNQLHFPPQVDKYTQRRENQPKRESGAFSLCQEGQQNEKLSLSTIEKNNTDSIQKEAQLHNEDHLDDKKQLQNLRYQRKNIEANIVNKIYTYLKTSLKFGEPSTINFVNNKEKALTYYKVLEKLQKAKKQNIKRQFLKSLMSMQSSLPGYNKIAKQLQRKGQSIQQFEYNIRVIIKNYLRVDAINSILTSKKMNPQLWKDHIRKLRELDEYLFAVEEIQNQP